MFVKEIKNNKNKFQNYKRKAQKLLFDREEEIKKIRFNYSNHIQRSKLIPITDNNDVSSAEERSQRSEGKVSH